MAKIENTEYEELTEEELKRVRAKMADDTGRIDETSDGDDTGDSGGVGFADRPEEVR
ncbi:hypothetical protein [Halobaculum sp. EA56]|uniref:hypothetical protein n=1 Tax=Halobaculum sp. EA56 TaxID=3421648 RepID=UPI003EBC3FB0